MAVVDGTNITAAQLEQTLRIAKLSLKTSYPTPGTDEWLTLRTRALESLAHDAELRAWARDLGATVKQSAVDAAVKDTLAGAFPGKTAGSIDQAKVGHGVQDHGHDARPAAGAHRDQAARAGRGAKDPAARRRSPTRRSRRSTRRTRPRSTRSPSAAKCGTSWSRRRRWPIRSTRELESSDAKFAALAKRYSTDGTKANGGDLGIVNRNGLVKPFADVAFTIEEGVVSEPIKTEFGWHIDPGPGAGAGRRARARSTTSLKAQIRSQLVEKARQKHIAQQFARAEIELSRNIEFAPGYAPPLPAQQ